MAATIEVPSRHGEDGWLRQGGVRLRYRETGDPAGTPVLVLHGLMGHAREWDVLIDALAARCRVVAFDQRGHGASDWPPDYHLDSLVEDLIGVLEAVGLAGATLIGHSLGGLVGVLCAAKRPDLLGRLVMIDIGPDSLVSDWGRRELPAVLAEFSAASYTSQSEAVEAWLSGDPLARESLLRHYVRHALRRHDDGRWRWRFDAAGFPRLLATIDRAELWSAVDRVSCPTLVIRGEQSGLLPARSAAELIQRLAVGSLVEIPRGGHDLGVHQPEAVAVAVRAFLGW